MAIIGTETAAAHDFGSLGAANGPEGLIERRESCRHRTVFRVVKLSVRGTTNLTHLCNISDEGMMVSIDEAIEVGEAIAIELSPAHKLTGRVKWAKEGHCGVSLDAPIDSGAMLHDLAEEQRSTRHRAPRLEAHLFGVAYSERGMHPIRTVNVSQQGIGFTHDGRLEPGLHLLMTLENGIERRGVVRWSHEHSAGILLTEPLGCSDVNRCASMTSGGHC